MKKKIFTLLTLLLTVCSGAWASTVDDLITISSATTIVANTLNGESALVDKTLYADGKVLSIGGSGYSAKGNVIYNDIEYTPVYQIKSNRQLALKIGFNATITVVGSTNSSRSWRIGTSSAGDEIASGSNGANNATGTIDGSTTPKVVYINASSDLYLAAIIITANDAPSLSASPSSINLKVTNAQANPTAKFTLSGSLLTARETVNLSFASSVTGLSVEPASVTVGADGKVNEEITVSYSSTEAVDASSVILNATRGTEASCEITVNYSAVFYEFTAITETTTFDLSKTGTNLSTVTAEEFVLLADAGSEATFASNIQVKGVGTLDVSWRSDAIQAGYFKLKTTKPGKITVKFSDVGGSDGRPNRFANVNGTRSNVSSNKSGTKVTCSAIPVSAGEIIIKGEIEGEGNTFTDNQIRVYEITFTELEGDEGDVVSVTDAAYATHVLADDIDFTQSEGVTAYKAKVVGDNIQLIEVEQAPAGTPLVIAATKDVYTLQKATTTPAAVADNDLKAATTTIKQSDATPGNTIYVLNVKNDVVGFYKLSATGSLQAGKAYIEAPSSTSAREMFGFSFYEDATGIKAVENEKMNVENGEFFNLSGQRVAQPTKGLYIVNGKKVIK